MKKILKHIKKVIKRIIPLVVMGLISIPLLVVYLFTGLYDVFRQKHPRPLHVFMRYFYVNGALAWLFSPLNFLVDVICLPYTNKQIYKLEDFPQKYQDEINEITVGCEPEKMLDTIKDQLKDSERAMLFYKWYGHNMGEAKEQPGFHKKFKYILTIGVSVFNKQQKTNEHFGWLRAGIRVLYNIDPILRDGAYIEVNGQRHTWKTDGRLFIFDDTVLHQAFNLTDAPRHALFIDIVRPSLVPFVITSIIKALGSISLAIPATMGQTSWKFLK